MAKNLKLPRLKKKVAAYAYMLPERGMLYTAKGVPIVTSEQKRYLCGGCFLLLRNMACRSWSRSPSQVHLLTHTTVAVPYAVSSCGCVLHTLNAKPSLFPSFHQERVFTFMGLYLDCRCLGEIAAKVDASFPMEKSDSIANWLHTGDEDSWIAAKLMEVSDWRVI